MQKTILHYNNRLKQTARYLRTNMTESEALLWFRLRRKQILGVQFYRQRPIGNYVADFFAPKARLVIEVDGSQHGEEEHALKDNERDDYLAGLGIKVLRFNSREVFKEMDSVVQVIFETVEKRRNPPGPPLRKGEV